MSEISVPTYQDLLWPTLKALEEKGGSASNEELSESIARIMNLPDAILEVPHNDGPLTKLDYRAAWARTHLKFIDAIQNSERGVWTLTDFGRQIASDGEVRRLVKDKRSQRRKERDQARPSIDDGTEDPIEELSWEETLLDLLQKLAPAAFERLCQRILRESGFTKVEVTGRSGDGGIDGSGVLRLNLLSFHVRFQCKRYSGSVGAGEIRDFRGAVIGRADKGLFLTTGRFTKDAEREAVRDGAPAIDLINGAELCHLLKNLKLGVLTATVERVEVQPDFFASV
ncbi:restriction endonuclease [Inquilinus sp. NPDC058860]|uniref:restriction endonuclease n=1 Tax=Inquilinus sp. NPDC058860 TaxID=3346652 RepID=UPI0036AA6C8F